MDGVTILSEVSYRGMELCQVFYIWFAFIGITSLLFFAMLDLWNNCRMWGFKLIYSGAAIFISLLFLLLALSATDAYRTFHTEYTVAVDDTVGFNEFYNHYKIISQDDNTYTVKEIDE